MQNCEGCEHCEIQNHPNNIVRFWCTAPVPDWCEDTQGHEVKPDGGRWCDCWNQKP